MIVLLFFILFFFPKKMGEESKTKIKEIFFFSLHLSFQLLKLLPQAVPVDKTFKDRLVAYIDKNIQNYKLEKCLYSGLY